jgi:hypothetical protein
MRTLHLLILSTLGLVCLGASAQAPAEVRVGNSYVALPGPWKFAPGDSPLVNGKPAWAATDFNDATWATMDLRPKAGEIDPVYGAPDYLTGWSARGFHDLAGFAWYRLRIHVAEPGKTLALKMPDHVDDAYQIFANGELIGTFGDFSHKNPTCYRSRPIVFALPKPDADGDIELAMRFYMEPFVAAVGTTPDNGGMHETPLAGLPAAVEYIRAQEVRARLLSLVAGIFVALLMLIAAAGAFWIWLLDRPRTTYLWLLLALLGQATWTPVLLVGFFTYAIPQEFVASAQQMSYTLGLVGWIIFWRRWFLLDPNRRTDTLIAALATVIAAMQIYIYFLGGADMSVRSVVHALLIRTIGNGILGVMLFIALYQGARKDRTGALLALLPILLLSVSVFNLELLSWLRIRTAFFPFGIAISVGDIASVLMVLVVGALVARRFIESQVSQRIVRQSIEQDLDKARELQQHVLVPEPIRSPMFAVDTAYYPARSVGGDFFQVIPARDGSLLIVVGDVSGKGMAAAMLVAVLVGAICTRADETFDPAAILETLNERLLGRAGGHFATCIVAHLRAGGEMRIGNAGHIPPYRNGVAMDLEGSLPLGIVANPKYDILSIPTEPGDYLTFVTDGVPEARNAGGQLLGFDRLTEISSRSAEQIAAVAIRYGQDDDITVVSVRVREAV